MKSALFALVLGLFAAGPQAAEACFPINGDYVIIQERQNNMILEIEELDDSCQKLKIRYGVYKNENSFFYSTLEAGRGFKPLVVEGPLPPDPESKITYELIWKDREAVLTVRSEDEEGVKCESQLQMGYDTYDVDRSSFLIKVKNTCDGKTENFSYPIFRI